MSLETERDLRADMIAWLLREHSNELSPMGRDYTDAEIAAALAARDTEEPGWGDPK